MKDPAPHRAKNDDAGHVECPTGETELAHLGFTHRVEEELKIPDDASHCGENVVAQQRNLKIIGLADSRSSSMLAASRPAKCRMFLSNRATEILVACAISEMQKQTPKEVCSKST